MKWHGMQARLFLLCEFLRVNFTVNVPSFKDKSQSWRSHKYASYKVGCIVLMVISSDFRMGRYGDDGHREAAHHFNMTQIIWILNEISFLLWLVPLLDHGLTTRGDLNFVNYGFFDCQFSVALVGNIIAEKCYHIGGAVWQNPSLNLFHNRQEFRNFLTRDLSR